MLLTSSNSYELKEIKDKKDKKGSTYKGYEPVSTQNPPTVFLETSIDDVPWFELYFYLGVISIWKIL